MTLGSLFAGIGGFELAAIWAGITPMWSNEIDKFCCDRLKENFCHEIIQKDIREIDPSELQSVDIISGGDPCQPHSVAGLGKGEADDRYLWPEMFRIIRAIHPSFVINENVDGSIANGVLDSKIDDLESEGYSCQAYNIPAESVGALHRRYRVWLIAYNPNSRSEIRESREFSSEESKEFLQEWNQIQHNFIPVDLRDTNTDTHYQRPKEQHITNKPEIFQEGLSRYFGFGSNPHGNITGDQIKSGIIRMLDGLPEGMDYPERNKRIKALGNAIVPQVAYEFFRWMKETTPHE